MNINERVKFLRKELKLTQKDFGNKIAVAQSYLTNIENGVRPVTDKIIKLICLEFNVNEVWLRTGEGEMLQKLDPDEELAELMGKISGSDNQFIKDTIISLAKLDEKDLDFIKQLMDRLIADK